MAPSVSTGNGAETSRANTLPSNRLITSILPRRLTGFSGWCYSPIPKQDLLEIDVAHPSKRKGSGFELEVVKVLQGEAVKIPLSGSVAGFAGDIGAVLTRQDNSTNLQCGPSRRGRTGPTRGDR